MFTQRCGITGKEFPSDEVVKGQSIRASLFKAIKSNHPDFQTDSYIHKDVLNTYRKEYLETLLNDDGAGLSQVETEVVNSITADELVSKNIEEEITFGNRLSDKIAEFGGSWTFIISFFSFILFWMVLNILILWNRPFDPYPFILLNLILSCLAAIQAPIIMMSQNRQEEKDRKRSIQDYKINLKSELEIRALNEKIDHLIVTQNHKLLEVQEIQIEMMEEILKKVEKS